MKGVVRNHAPVKSQKSLITALKWKSYRVKDQIIKSLFMRHF